jgi:D-3-phosphoglycerate dehydrogenase
MAHKLLRHEKMKILIASDNGVKVEHFSSAFAQFAKEYEITIIEIDRKVNFKPETPSEMKLKEYIGSPKQLVNAVDDADILIVNYAPITAEVIYAGRRLKLIGVTRGGPVNVDLEAATKRGILVVNAPERTVEAVADFTLGLMIAEARNIARAYHMLRTGRVLKINPRLYEDSNISGVELSGKTLGVIGLGRIGKKVALRAEAFGMNVVAYDPYATVEDAEGVRAKLTDLNSLLKVSDFITIHVRYTKETEHMIGKEQIGMMKSTAYLVNTSRGGVIDEKALFWALKEKRIAGAALDVVEEEPISPSNPLLKLDNITITPHIAGLTQEVPLKSAIIMAEEVKKFINGEKLSRLVNKEVLRTIK